MLLYDISSTESYNEAKSLYKKSLKYALRDDLSFGYLIGTKSDLRETPRFKNCHVENEEASDFAYDNSLLFNEVSCIIPLKNTDLLLKTLRTRTARLIGERGTELMDELKNIEEVQIKEAYSDSDEEQIELNLE